MTYTVFRDDILAEYNRCCAWCGQTDFDKMINVPYHINNCLVTIANRRLCLDHVWTRKCGGTDHKQNLQLLCNRCNVIKNSTSMPKLPPRLPELDYAKCYKDQERLKRVMRWRRKSPIWEHITKKGKRYVFRVTPQERLKMFPAELY